MNNGGYFRDARKGGAVDGRRTLHQIRMKSPLSPGEVKIYELLIRTGWSNKKLAQELGKTEGSVKTQLTHILAHYKTTRSELITSALWNRIRELEQELRTKQENAA